MPGQMPIALCGTVRGQPIIFVSSPIGKHCHDERTKEPKRGQKETCLDPEGKTECEKIQTGRKKYPGHWQAGLNAMKGAEPH